MIQINYCPVLGAQYHHEPYRSSRKTRKMDKKQIERIKKERAKKVADNKIIRKNEQDRNSRVRK